ncbi:MAG TPA: pentapeptide repeat-containing protein [Solirubrobacteraceae bacterium]|nr:pentapeptide repeat-containing protein [Solirubrobacteraceae bacterium]
MELSGVLLEQVTLRGRRIRLRECELRGVTIDAAQAPGLTLVDVVLRDCELANIDAREATIRRVRAERCRLVGLRLTGGGTADLRVVDSTLQLASFAGAGLQRVVFERVNLAEASFQEARLQEVHFVDCRLTGADFRGASLRRCAIRGASLDGVLGVAALRGVRMPWEDIVASAGALAAALGVEVDEGA